MTTTTQPTASPPARHVPRFELTLTVLGAVCGAVVPAVMTAEEATDPVKLVGMALGAALPPLIGAAASRPEVRVAVVAVTVVAVAVSYSGMQVFAKATGTPPAVPPPKEIVNSLPWVDGDGPVDGEDDPEEGEKGCEDPLTHGTDELGLEVCPAAIICTAEDGCDSVTVTSTGTAPLRDFWLEFEGDAGSYLTASGCENAVLAKGDECTIALEFFPEKAPASATTHLVIHQNLPKVPTRVPVAVHGELPPEPNLALGRPSCDDSGLVADPDSGTVSGQVVIEAPLTVTDLPDQASVEATVEEGHASWPAEVDLAAGTVRASVLYAGPPPGQWVVVVDPGNEFAESSEDDNVASC